ncbi:MAG: fasciclin domain-containing protein [Rhodobacteraceae bacterium]|nr:fasciclin domain-containing protein [Paracoccaceae bacterium]
MLSGPGPLTVFAPTDEAFAKAPPELLEGLLQPSSKIELVKLLGLHTIAGRVTATDWTAAASPPGP